MIARLWSRKKVTLYRVLDGKAVTIPERQLVKALSRKLPDGRYVYTTNEPQS